MSNRVAEASRLSHQLRVLKRGAWLVALVTIVVTGAAVGLSLRQEALYRSGADVFLGSENLSADLTGTITRDPERELSTQARLARLPAVAERAVELAGETGQVGLLSSSQVGSSGDADILTFSVTAPGKELAARLATSYAKAYTEYRREIEYEGARAARKRVELQLAKLRAAGVRPESSLYLTLEQRRGEIRTVETLRGSKALLVRSANVAQQIQPKPRRNAILGGFLGLILGVVLVLLRDALNTRVRSVEEVQERLGSPLLARVPDFNGRRRGPEQLDHADRASRPSDAEAFRILATNIEFANVDVGARTLMITSANRAEGKSTVVANLAAAFARRGKRVILADLDLRRPTVATLFGANQRPGVTDVAVGDVALDEALVRVPLEDLSPAGTEGSRNGSGGIEHGTAEPGSLEILPSGTSHLTPASSLALGTRRT